MKQLLALVLLLAAPLAAADRQWFYNVGVREVVVDDSKFGQCMARVRSADIQAGLPSCKASYLTFDCAAELEGSSRAANTRKFELATVALVAKRDVAFLVTDQKTINGYCYVEQARLL